MQQLTYGGHSLEVRRRIQHNLTAVGGSLYFRHDDGFYLSVLDTMTAIYTEGLMITRINVPPLWRGKGYGSLILDTCCTLADLHQVLLCLIILPSGGLSLEQLVRWYGRRGFDYDSKTNIFGRPPR